MNPAASPANKTKRLPTNLIELRKIDEFKSANAGRVHLGRQRLPAFSFHPARNEFDKAVAKCRELGLSRDQTAATLKVDRRALRQSAGNVTRELARLIRTLYLEPDPETGWIRSILGLKPKHFSTKSSTRKVE